MKKYIFLLIYSLLWAVTVASGQNITHAEYFFNTDPGVGNGIAIEFTAGEEVDFITSVSTGSLEGGFHTLFVRFRNEEGIWSLVQGSTFYVNTYEPEPLPLLVSVEYFFDDDPGVNNGTPISVTSGYETDFVLEISMNDFQDLGPGFHHLFLRFQNENRIWSLSSGRALYIPDTTITEPAFPMVAGEYYIDEDPGFGMGFPLTFDPGFEVEETFMMPVSDLSDGEHLLFVRFKNDHETWGLPKSCEFSVTSVGVESYGDDGFSVYPNPAIGYTTVKCQEIAEIEILNITGKCILNQQLMPGSTQLYLEGVPPGIYLLRYVNQARSVTKRLVVLKP